MSIATQAPASKEESFWLSHFTRPIFFFAAVLTFAGIYAALQVPISVFPDTNFPRVVIGIDNGVMPVEQMEVTITRPIEDAVNSVPGLVTVRSTTSRGSAEVSLFFDWNTDMYKALQLTDAALSKVEQTLPSTARITTNRLTFATFPILGYSLTSDTVPQTQLWELATYDLKPPLNRVLGVSTVTVQGGQVPEFRVMPDLALLAANGVTVTDLVNAIQASNIVDSPGLYEANHQLILGLVGAQVHDAEGLRQLVVKTTAAGAPVRVADVATVEPSTLPVYTTVTANGKNAVLLNIARQPSSNTVAVADAVACRDRAAAAETAAGREARALLRPVAAGARQHLQRARRHLHRARPRLHHPLPLPARLDFVADRGSRYPGHGRGHDPCPLGNRAELQPDDAGRTRRRYRPGDRRRHRRGRKHRHASRQWRAARSAPCARRSARSRCR